MAHNGKGILESIEGLFTGHKNNTQENGGVDVGSMVSGLESALAGSGLGKELISKLSNIKSFDASQIQSVLSALSGSADTKVQEAKNGLEQVKDNGTDFVSKLKGYLASAPQLIQALLPTLQKILGGAK